jgi:tetratricopeptide (TPR) repeat protein
LFRDAARHETLHYDTDAAFAFEATVLRALLDLAHASGRALDVAAAVEVEVDRAAESGVLYLLPKAFFAALAATLAGAPAAFSTLHAQFLDLVVRLPPRADRRELPALTTLADLATQEQDHARAARLIERSLKLIDFFGVDAARYVRAALGEPAPFAGFDPIARLRADGHMARARAHRVMGENESARQAYASAVAAAPFDAWHQLRVGAELREDDLDRDGARQHVLRAMELLPFDADLVARAARILAWAGFGEDFEVALARLDELRACGLAQDTVEIRLGIAEALVDLGRPGDALAEVRAAVALDPAAEQRVKQNPLLRDLRD